MAKRPSPNPDGNRTPTTSVEVDALSVVPILWNDDDLALVDQYVATALNSLAKSDVFNSKRGSFVPAQQLLRDGIVEAAQLFIRAQRADKVGSNWDDLKLVSKIAKQARELATSLELHPTLAHDEKSKLPRLRGQVYGELRYELEKRGSSLSVLHQTLERLAISCDSLMKRPVVRRSKLKIRLDVAATAPFLAKLWSQLSDRKFKRAYTFFPSGNAGRFKSAGARFVQIVLLSFDDTIAPRTIKTALERNDARSS
jgi:hypothetical protein